MNVLILGKGSYLGEHLKEWLEQYPKNYSVEIVPTKNRAWEKKDFSQYNTVINFAGIAHISNITADMEEMFYSVNRDLAIDMCKVSKKAGVKHFIHFSSMNVYGDFCDNVSDREAVNPTSFYGRSKLDGDIGIQALSDDEYIVSSIGHVTF